MPNPGIRSLLFHSKSLIWKSNCKWFSHVALYKRVMWANRSCSSLKKSDVNDSLMIRENCSWKTSEKFVFFIWFLQFSPFFRPKSKLLPLLFAHLLFLNGDLSNSLPWFFTKEQKWAIRSGCLWHTRDCEQFAQIAQDKKAMGAIHSYSPANHSSAHSLTDERIPNPENVTVDMLAQQLCWHCE